MRLGDRTRDWLVTGAFLAVIGGLIALGWSNRERGVRLAVGEDAPALRLPRIDGGEATLAEYRGKVVLVNIWATWCSPCRLEMPSIQAVYEAYADEGLEVLAVAVDDDPGERQPDGRIAGKVSEFVEQLGLTFPVAVDPTGGTERLFRTEYLPTTVLVDRQGRIRLHEVGGRFWDQQPYVDMIESLLKET